MSEFIKLDDNTYAEVQTPDPKRILNTEQLERELKMKEQKLQYINQDIEHLNKNKSEIETEIDKIKILLN